MMKKCFWRRTVCTLMSNLIALASPTMNLDPARSLLHFFVEKAKQETAKEMQMTLKQMKIVKRMAECWNWLERCEAMEAPIFEEAVSTF